MGEVSVFGMLLKRYRRAVGLTQEELAERARLSVGAITDLERGARRSPRKDTVQLLADALTLSAGDRATFEAAARRAAASMAPPLPGGRALRRADPPPLVGRAREVTLLERHLAGDGAPVLLLAGEPGIGKSRLLCEAIALAPSYGWVVLYGDCQRRGGQEPYAPLLGALKGHIRDRTPAQVRADLPGCAWLVRLLPELAGGPIEPLPAWALPPEQERRLMVEAVARFLGNVGGPRGTLLVLDDLQWAGPDALDLLAALMRMAIPPLRVVGAYRDTEVRLDDPLTVMLTDLAHAGLATRHQLGPLEQEEAAHLLAHLLAGADAPTRTRVLVRAGGVPFFLVSCAQALRLSNGAAGSAELPWDVVHSVRQRVAALPPGAHAVLGAAAVVGRVVPLAVLENAAALPEEEVLVALEAMCQQGLLRDLDAEGYQFAHDVIREVVEADLGTARRTVLHRRIAAALETAPGAPPLDRLAYHYGHSGEPDKAVLYLEQAGDQATARAARAAAEHYYGELVARLDALGRVQDAARARAKLGAVLKEGGHLDAALEVLEQAAATYRAAEDLARWGSVSTVIGEVHQMKGTIGEALERLQPLLVALEERGAWQGVASLSVIVAHLLGQAGCYGEQFVLAQRAVALAREMGDDQLLAYALRRCGFTLYLAGHAAEALAAMEEAIPLAVVRGDLSTLAWTLDFASAIYGDRGDVEAQHRYAEQAQVYAEHLDDPHLLVDSTCTHGALAFHSGDWAQARWDYERALAASRRMSRSWLPALPLGLLAQLCWAEGAWRDAEQYLAEGVCTADGGGGLWARPWMQSLVAYGDLLAGRPDAARIHLVPLLDGPDLAVRGYWQSLPVRVLLAWAHLNLGAVRSAAALAAAASQEARTERSQPALAEALWMEARVALRQRHWRVAERAVLEGLAVARQLHQPYREARLLHVSGELHRQKGEVALAREQLAAALAIFCRLGACPHGAEVAQSLADLQG